MTRAAGIGSAAMFGYRITNQAAAAITNPAANRLASRAVTIWMATSASGIAAITAISSGTTPGTENSAASAGSARVSAMTAPPTMAVIASGRRSRGPTGVPSPCGRPRFIRSRTSTISVTSATITSAAAAGVTTRLPGSPWHAADPGLTASTLARLHSTGLRMIHRKIGANRAPTAATRASSHVRREGPCHTSPMK